MPGIRQRLKAADEAMRLPEISLQPDSETDSKFETPTDFGASEFKRGKMTARKFKELAKTSPESTLPSSNTNLSRNVIRKLSKTSTMHEVYAADGVFWDAKAQKSYTDEMYFLLPYEIQDADTGPVEDWCKLEPSSYVHSTRKSWARTMEVENHSEIAAIGVWGDTAPYHTRDSVFLLLWSALSGIARPRYWLCAMSKRMLCDCGCMNRHSFDPVWDVLRWIFQVWLYGKYPSKRHDGVPFAESTRIGDAARAENARKKKAQT